MGQEDASLDGGAWSNLDPQRGEVLEVYLPSTNLEDPGDFWAAFLVFDKRILSDGSILVTVRCMGCEDVTLFTKLQRRMNVVGGHLHLCLSGPCAISDVGEDVDSAVHVTHLRRWEFRDIISADYISRSMRTQSRGWHAEIMERELTGGLFPVGERKQKRKPRAGRGLAPGKGTKGNKTPGLSEAAKQKLRDRLRQVRARTLGTAAVEEPVMISDGEEMEDDTPEEERSDSVEEPRQTKTPAPPFPPVPPMAIADLAVKKESKSGRRHGSKPFKEKKKAVRRTEKDIGKVVAIKGSSSKDWRRQLVDKAVHTAEERSKEKRKHGKKKESKTKKMQEALALILTGGSKSKKEKKKAMKRRRMRSDGVIESYSEDSNSSSSDEEESSSSKSELDTPMKKRSRQAPGSILAMLANHVKEQLDQGATTEVPDHGTALTSGVRVMTYFMLHLKPSFPNNLKELRELHHLAACIDVLRSGDIARTGDGLAARFISIHQALLDQSWGTAKHMELFPMEDTTAATTSMVLATRKHTKLISKVQNQQAWNLWSGYGRGRGKGKGDWWSRQEYKGDVKGEKGKTKKGKGKGKGKWYQSEGYDQDWKANKEKPEDKKA